MALVETFWRNILGRLGIARLVTKASVVGLRPEAAPLEEMLQVGTRWMLQPARTVALRVADAFQDAVASEPSHVQQYAGLLSDATKRLVSMLDEVATSRYVIGRLVHPYVREIQARGVEPLSEGWYAIRKAVESGSLEAPGADVAQAGLNRVRQLAEQYIPGWKPLENYWPMYVNPEAIERFGYNRAEALLRASLSEGNLALMRRDRALLSAARDMLGRDPTDEDIVELAIQSVLQRPTRALGERAVYIRPSGHLLFHRYITLPDELRLHPYEEFISYLNEAQTYLFDTKILGPGGQKARALLSLLRGEILPERLVPEGINEATGAPWTLADVLGPEMAEKVMRAQRDSYRYLAGRWPKRLADGLETVLRYTLGAFQEDEVMEGVRATVSSLGSMTMMVFSAIPNLSQQYAEIITRGVAPFLRGLVRAYKTNKDDILDLAADLGQMSSNLLKADLRYSFSAVTDLIEPHLRSPQDVLNAVAQAMRKPSISERARAMATLSHRLSGFRASEAANRRTALGTIIEYAQELQQKLAEAPNDPALIRAVQRFGMTPEQFLSMPIRERPMSFTELMQLTPDKYLSVLDWERMFLRGIDGSQFLYLPLDFPFAWSRPWVGSVLVQFRRFAYAQATKVVSMAFEEAKHHNFAPLVRMVAAVPTVGASVSFLRDAVSGRSLVWVPGHGFRKRERPPIERAAEVRTVFGPVPEWFVERMKDAVAIGLMGVYTDALFTLAEGRPLVQASWVGGVYPTELFNLSSKIAGAVAEVVRGGEPDVRKERFPAVREAVRAVIRQVPFAPVRFIQPHILRGPSGVRNLREAGIEAFVANNWELFNEVQSYFISRDDPITTDEIANYMHRYALRRMGLTAAGPQRGEPGYVPRRGVPAFPSYFPEITRRADILTARTLGAATGEAEEEGE